MDGLYFTNQKSVASYFKEVSDGRMAMTGDVFGYFTLAVSTSSCDYGDWGADARLAAKSAGIDLSAYTNIVHAFAKQSSCWWGGLAQVDGRLSWINGSMTLYVTSHELGHNFGAHHASTMTCTKNGVRVPLSSSCTINEYGDPFDVMGTSAQRHVQTWHRRQMGFLSARDQLTVTQNGRYFVTTAQVAAESPRIVRIQRSSSEFYYLEFRQPYGLYDNFSTTAAAVSGVMIRIAPNDKRVQSKLLDMNPATSGFGDAPLAVGQTFNDPASSVSITTVSVGPNGATVRIQLAPDTVPPGTPAALTATTSATDAIRLDWAASTDDLEIGGYRVIRDGELLGTTTDTSWTDASLPQDVTYRYTVEALDSSLNASIPAEVTHHLDDTMAPTAPATVTAEQSGHRTVSVTWPAATDNVAVVAYRVLRNGTLLATTDATALVDTTVLDGYRYEYMIQAVDAAGHVGPGTSASVMLPDVTAPTAPGPLSLTGLSTMSTQLSWQPATDNVAVSGYRVARDGAVVATLDADARSYSDTVVSDGTYNYGVAALDSAGNIGPELTAQVTIVSDDSVAPTVPQKLRGEQLGKRRISLTWQASTDDRAGTIRYRIFRNGSLLATVTTTSYVDQPMTVAWYTYKVQAVDAARNKSAFSAKITVKAVKAL